MVERNFLKKKLEIGGLFSNLEMGNQNRESTK
jgi:hypothetical protein